MQKALSFINFFRLALIPLLFFGFHASGQTITKNSASTVTGAVCPGSSMSYTVSLPANFSTCQITWTASNGVINGQSNQQTVSVTWNDVPGATAGLTVTFVNCPSGNANANLTSTKNELILSVKNQAWGSYGASVNVDYCTKTNVNLIVPRMFVQGTGGIAQPVLTEVTYGWTIPTGWREVGTNRTGFFGTTTNSISIQPINCSLPGTVTVFGTLVGSGPFCNSSAQSSTASISLNGANPVATVGPQPGYVGASACNTTPVVFYATPSVALGCIASYAWTYPTSWTFVSQSGNSITLKPGGTPADSGPIRATINTTCGSSLVSGIYTPPFILPTITGDGPVCTTKSLAIQNITGAVTWSINYPAIATVSQSGVVSRVGTQFGEVTVTATPACAGVPAATKKIWIGQPFIDGTFGGGQLLAFQPSPLPPGWDDGYLPYNLVCNSIYTDVTLQPKGTTNGSLQKVTSNPSSIAVALTQNTAHFYFWAVNQTLQLRYTTSNACGTTTNNYFFKSIVCGGGGSDPCDQYLVSPNPSSSRINIVVPHVPPPCESSVVKADATGQMESRLIIQSITLYDSQGQIKRSQKFSGETKNAELDISDLPRGNYVLKISDGKKIETHRIFIN